MTSRPALAEELRAVRAQGFAMQTGELRDETACVAVPVRSATGPLVATLAMTRRVDQEDLLRRRFRR